MILFFFFKQKTAYEMRISDWSSDVCSSDLYAFELTARSGPITGRNGQAYFQVRFRYPRDEAARAERLRAAQIAMQAAALEAQAVRGALDHAVIEGPRNMNYKVQGSSDLQPSERSEEHTSELQSLLRNSYAVFCLKKKQTT